MQQQALNSKAIASAPHSIRLSALRDKHLIRSCSSRQPSVVRSGGRPEKLPVIRLGPSRSAISIGQPVSDPQGTYTAHTDRLVSSPCQPDPAALRSIRSYMYTRHAPTFRYLSPLLCIQCTCARHYCAARIIQLAKPHNFHRTDPKNPKRAISETLPAPAALAIP